MAECSFDGCGRKSRSHGLCGGHLYQRNTGKDLRPLRSRKVSKTCAADGCEELVLAKGLCSTHYSRSKRRVEPTTTPDTGNTRAILFDLLLADRITREEATAFLKVRQMVLSAGVVHDESGVLHDDAKHDADNGEEE